APLTSHERRSSLLRFGVRSFGESCPGRWHLGRPGARRHPASIRALGVHRSPGGPSRSRGAGARSERSRAGRQGVGDVSGRARGQGTMGGSRAGAPGSVAKAGLQRFFRFAGEGPPVSAPRNAAVALTALALLASAGAVRAQPSVWARARDPAIERRESLLAQI